MKRSNFSNLCLFTALVAPIFVANNAAAQSGGLDEIIVTAQKRAENIQDVPISVSTLATENLEAILQGGEDIRALATRIPGLYAESSNGRVAPRFYIRGLGNTDFDLAASQPVSIIMDDVVQENVVLKSFPLFDIERVEVLRGPQGTLFGRNTPAGIVKFDSVKPSEETSGFISASYGTFNSAKIEGAVGGALGETINARVSGLYTRRDDWITNVAASEKDAMGGYEDIAGRLQVAFEPSEDVNLLLNVHARDLTGTASIFRANVFDAGSNELNDLFQRNVVYYDEGDNNPQEYSNFGASANLSWDLSDTITMTSITGYESADGTSLGDIDGGAGFAGSPNGPFPGFIPFPSATLDGIDDLNQFTQELRFASNLAGPFNWQAGFYYFDSDLTITTNPFFAPATTVRHDNKSWSLFGQGSYELSEQTKLTAGLRYTDDNKDFEAIAANFPVAPVSTEDEQLSWDVSLAHDATDNVNFYARIARGFRAPSIQGRDVAFFSPPSTADSETITSYELGFKSEFSSSVRFNGAAFYYDANDLQFSAIGGGGNFNQLVNADGRAYGFEADLEFAPTEFFNTTLGFSYNDTKITQDGLKVAPCGGGCTVLDDVDANGLATIEGNPFPQAPDVTINWTARYAVPFRDGEIYGLTDWAYQGDTNFFLYESAEFNSKGNVEGGLRVGYGFGEGQYDVALFVRNILDAENVKGGIDFNNLTGFVNEPRIFGVAASANF